MANFNVGDKVEIVGGDWEGYFGIVTKSEKVDCKVFIGREYINLRVEVHMQTPSNKFDGVMVGLLCSDASVKHMQPELV